jgi:hypothetical protein
MGALPRLLLWFGRHHWLYLEESQILGGDGVSNTGYLGSGRVDRIAHLRVRVVHACRGAEGRHPAGLARSGPRVPGFIPPSVFVAILVRFGVATPLRRDARDVAFYALPLGAF